MLGTKSLGIDPLAILDTGTGIVGVFSVSMEDSLSGSTTSAKLTSNLTPAVNDVSSALTNILRVTGTSTKTLGGVSTGVTNKLILVSSLTGQLAGTTSAGSSNFTLLGDFDKTLENVTSFGVDQSIPVILSVVGNKPGSVTTITIATNVDLTSVDTVTITRGGIAMTSITVVDATHVTGVEPLSGLEVGVNHDIILGVQTNA